MDELTVVRRSIARFRRSGILRPDDGFRRFGARIVLAPGHEALA